jgi:hypothetical protein
MYITIWTELKWMDFKSTKMANIVNNVNGLARRLNNFQIPICFNWNASKLIQFNNVREYRRNNQKRTNHKNWQHRVRTQDEEKYNKYVLDTTMHKHKQSKEVNMTDLLVLKQFTFLNHIRRASTIDVTVIVLHVPTF